MFQIHGDLYFRTDLKRLAHKILMLKSNFKLIGRKFVRCFIALQNVLRICIFLNENQFPLKSSNFDKMSLGSRVQIRYTHKLSMHKADFS